MKKNIGYSTALFALTVTALCSYCPAQTQPDKIQTVYKKSVPEWTKSMTIYEVNLRQYSRSGSFKDFEQHLPRLKEMGVEILWFMPVNPIGVKGRKGSLGSYYSVSDYLGINPEFGTMDDFKQLVKKCHETGMYVILDWVANHTSWDNKLITEHPEWYKHDSSGRIIPPVPDWADVAALNYDNKDLRRYMTDAMKFWLIETGIDGFRCDVAGMVPVDFWNELRPALDSVKPVFMLAEWEDPAFHEKAFDMSYTWAFHHLITEIAQGKKTVLSLDTLFLNEEKQYAADAYRMYFTSNHDENSWNGTPYEKFGGGVKTYAVLTFTIPGMPLIYSGQEAGLKKRLQFFDKDTIEWKNDEFFGFYMTLIALKKENKALWNGVYGGRMSEIKTTADKVVFAFHREKDGDEIVVLLNLTKNPARVKLTDCKVTGAFTEVFTKQKFEINQKSVFKLKGWDYLILERRSGK
ncbi:MAG TPA: alpha-amylase family glycosyl hydrolase [Bacteroidales bacterium]|nr:alpha-amylase family glycosyl hydrolase [Bacteroidales bacterium]